MLRFRDLIADTVNEYNRMSNFCRIFPARNSKIYDKYFSGNKQLAKVIYKVLFSQEVIPFGVVSNHNINDGIASPTQALSSWQGANASALALSSN